jgi:hypothetical protein
MKEKSLRFSVVHTHAQSGTIYLPWSMALAGWTQCIGSTTRQLGCATAYTYIQTFLKLVLLLVDYSQAKINLAGLFKLGSHSHDLRKGFLRMIDRTISIIENSNSVPQFWFLNRSESSWSSTNLSYLEILKIVQRVLVCLIGLGKIVRHEVAMTQSLPHLSIVLFKFNNCFQVFDCLWKHFLGS